MTERNARFRIRPLAAIVRPPVNEGRRHCTDEVDEVAVRGRFDLQKPGYAAHVETASCILVTIGFTAPAGTV